MQIDNQKTRTRSYKINNLNVHTINEYKKVSKMCMNTKKVSINLKIVLIFLCRHVVSADGHLYILNQEMSSALHLMSIESKFI